MKLLTDKQFDKELTRLREQISASTKPLPEEEKAARVKRASTDLMFFAQTYFPHYMTCAPSKLHRYFAKRYPEMIFQANSLSGSNKPVLKEATAAPRGNAKSTWTTLILPLWCAAYKYRHFPLIVSETNTQAADFISFIKLELEINERLAQDFPDLAGEGAVWRADTIITKNGVKIRGVGAGQKLRGMRHGASRPDLVIGDDLENDEAVLSPEQRKKLAGWFYKALMKICQPDTVFIIVGTILHYDSLLSELLKAPGWFGRKFQSVIRWAENQALWDEWENIFRDVTASKSEAAAAADAFFENNKKEMLAGTEVLWPQRESYYYLMNMRLSEGAANFTSEKQNEPINPEDSLFDADDVQFWDDEDINLKDVPFFGAVDPSLGKRGGRDPSVIVGGWWKNGILWLEIADEAKRRPDKIINDFYTYHEKYTFANFAVEAVQFQEFFATTLEEEAKKRGKSLPITQIHSATDKYLRIQRLQPWFKNGWVRLRRHHRALLTQISQYPMCAHDDLLDALEMLVNLCEQFSRRPRPQPFKVVMAGKSILDDLFKGFD
jgi:predicted phage terminase large subunit-like protein